VKRTALESRAPEICAGCLLALALVTIQILVGGTRLLFSLPACGVIAVGGVLLLFALRRVKPDPDQVCLTITALFFAYILVRASLSPVAYLARIDSYSVLGGLLVYFLVACFLTDSKQRIILLFLLLIFGVVHVLVGAIQFRNGDNFMPISSLQRFDYERRASGFYVCPNHLAGLLEVLGIFGLSITFWSRLPVWAKLISAYATVICYFGLILTGSRGGYLSAVGSLLVFLTLSGLVLRQVSGRFLLRVGGPAVIVAAVVGLAAFFFIHKNAYLSDRAQNMFEKNVRLKMWSAAIEQWKLQPLFGTGSGTYLYYGRQFRTPKLQTDPVYVHNDYLQLLAEYGLAGGALFLIFLGGHLANGWKNFRRLALIRVAVSSRLLSNAMALQLGAILAVAAYMIHSFLDFNLHIPANVLLLAFVFGVLANAGAQHQAELPEVRRSIFAWRLVLPAIALLVVAEVVRLLPGEYFAERARAALRDDQLETGAAFALRGLAWERNNPNLYQYLGSARFDQADRTSTSDASAPQFYGEALVAFETAYALAPREEAFAIGMADSYDALGRFNEGEWMYEEALALDPRSTSLAALYQAHLKKWRDSGTKELDKAATSRDSNEPQ
jgi:O-antigen ligase